MDVHQLPVGVTKFPGYFREKTGYTEPYAHIYFAKAMLPENNYLQVYMLCIHDLSELISYTYDILSFYKESAVGDERLNYACNVANTHGLDAAKVLRLVSRDVTENDTTVR